MSQEKPPKPITPQQAIEAVQELQQAGSAGDLERRTKLAETLIAGMEKMSGVPASEAQKQRIAAKIYEHTLLDAGKPEHAKALKEWITLGRVHDAIEKELTEPNHQPLLRKLKAEAPDTLGHLLEEVPHGDHSHTRVNTGIKGCLQNLDISHRQVGAEIMPSAETALRHYRAIRQSGKTIAEQVSGSHSSSSGYSGFSSGHSCGTGCGHDHASSSSSGGGVHYHGDTPCSHSHAPGGGTHEPHLPKGKSNAGWWGAGMVAAVGIGAYLINEYGKPRKNEIVQKPEDWKKRARKLTGAEERTL